MVFFFFQAEDGIRDADVTGVQTCALPISHLAAGTYTLAGQAFRAATVAVTENPSHTGIASIAIIYTNFSDDGTHEIGKAACRERGEISGGAGSLKKKKRKKGV